MNPYLSPEEEQEQREEKRRKAAQRNHECRGCKWALWQEGKVSCLFSHCVKDDPMLGSVRRK